MGNIARTIVLLAVLPLLGIVYFTMRTPLTLQLHHVLEHQQRQDISALDQGHVPVANQHENDRDLEHLFHSAKDIDHSHLVPRSVAQRHVVGKGRPSPPAQTAPALPEIIPPRTLAPASAPYDKSLERPNWGSSPGIGNRARWALIPDPPLPRLGMTGEAAETASKVLAEVAKFKAEIQAGPKLVLKAPPGSDKWHPADPWTHTKAPSMQPLTPPDQGSWSAMEPKMHGPRKTLLVCLFTGGEPGKRTATDQTERVNAVDSTWADVDVVQLALASCEWLPHCICPCRIAVTWLL